MSNLGMWLRGRPQAVRTVVLAVLTVGALVTGGVLSGQRVTVWAPIVAAVIAWLSLVVAASSAAANWQRQKRQATIDVWVKYMTDTQPARRALTQTVGTTLIDKDLSNALLGSPPTATVNGEELGREDLAKIASDIRMVLNGLEIIAAGVNFNVYDGEMLKVLGGTTIVSHFKRYKPYIDARRKPRDKSLRQKTAFIELEVLVADVERSRWLSKKRKLDEDRLHYLRTRRPRGVSR